jgi:hypothetical protein
VSSTARTRTSYTAEQGAPRRRKDSLVFSPVTTFQPCHPPWSVTIQQTSSRWRLRRQCAQTKVRPRQWIRVVCRQPGRKPQEAASHSRSNPCPKTRIRSDQSQPGLMKHSHFTTPKTSYIPKPWVWPLYNPFVMVEISGLCCPRTDESACRIVLQSIPVMQSSEGATQPASSQTHCIVSRMVQVYPFSSFSWLLEKKKDYRTSRNRTTPT